jgi:hypothetical protein
LLPFVLLYALATLVTAAIGLVAGQQYSTIAESLRIGTTRLSSRTFRIPMIQYPLSSFAAAAILLRLIAATKFLRPTQSTPPNP